MDSDAIESSFALFDLERGRGRPCPSLKVTCISCTQTLIVIGPLASCRLYRSNRRADAGLIAGSTISLLTELMLQHYNSSLDGGECEVLSAASHKAAPPPPSCRPPGIQSDGRTDGRKDASAGNQNSGNGGATNGNGIIPFLWLLLLA